MIAGLGRGFALGYGTGRLTRPQFRARYFNLPDDVEYYEYDYLQSSGEPFRCAVAKSTFYIKVNTLNITNFISLLTSHFSAS